MKLMSFDEQDSLLYSYIKQKGQNIKLEDKVCPVCKCLIYSKSKERPVMCECQWKQMENK